MSSGGNDFLTDTTFKWPPHPSVNKVDTHHHWVPTEYAEAVANAGGDPSGWPTPKWTQLETEQLMNHVGTATAILSITAPGACILKGEASYKLARSLNEQAAAMRDHNPSKFGFFATLPSLLDTTAALEEIAYALDKLGADGVCVFTRYGPGNHYLGHAKLQPIWEELNRRKAVVFVHPTHPADTQMVSKQMPQPLIDYPHETTRSAMDMLLSGTRKNFADCKVILSHAGGSLPYLISRVVTPLAPERAREFMEGFKSFYFDLALSSAPAVLRILLEMVPHEHILYGSDFPYAPPGAYPSFLRELEEFAMDAELRDKINFGNAMDLFPRLLEGGRARI